MSIETLKYQDDVTGQELFELAGRALADPSAATTRRALWKFVDRNSDR